MHIKTERRSPGLKNLRIADLDLFVAAAHLQNLGRAARLHHVSQSAASAAIVRVESAFGFRLCEHERRQFRLTRDGVRLLPRMENWLRQLRQSVAAEPYPIRIAATHAIARACIPPVLNLDIVELKLMRPDRAFAAVLRDEADVALVLDNSPWKGVEAEELSAGQFQLYCRERGQPLAPVLLPEDQLEVLALQQRWAQAFFAPLPVKARLPSWSLIADICSRSQEVGFLPDFLGRQAGLHPVSWQPQAAPYRLLALYLTGAKERLSPLFEMWRQALGALLPPDSDVIRRKSPLFV